MTIYPLAPQGVFLTLQGEGAMLGTPQVFVRFAGCDVNCPGCDTDYTVAERVDCGEIVRRVASEGGTVARWVWLTGGEPTLHDLRPLIAELHNLGFQVALATAGERKVKRGRYPASDGVDFVSVSPHRLDRWILKRGEQLNVVPTLNGLSLADLEGVDVSGFAERFVTPCWYTPGDRMDGVTACAEWVKRHLGWRLGIQAHRFWSIP